MAQITGGLVSVEDSKPHSNDEYGRKKVRVDLSFAVGEGESYEATFDLASEAASNRVTALLNGVSLRVVAAASETPPAAEEPKPRVRRTKAQIAADAAAAAEAGGTPANKPANAPSASGEELPDDPTDGEEHVIHLPDETELPDDGEALPDDAAALEDDEFTVTPEPEADAPKAITDADLNAAVQRKNADLAAPDIIRKLIATYNPDPKQVFQLRQIPAEKRAEFLTKLAALKKAG